MNIAEEFEKIANMLPANKYARRTVRDVCLTRDEDGQWKVLAGGHHAVHIGEHGGDYSGEGATPEEAIIECQHSIQTATS